MLKAAEQSLRNRTLSGSEPMVTVVGSWGLEYRCLDARKQAGILQPWIRRGLWVGENIKRRSRRLCSSRGGSRQSLPRPHGLSLLRGVGERARAAR